MPPPLVQRVRRVLPRRRVRGAAVRGVAARGAGARAAGVRGVVVKGAVVKGAGGSGVSATGAVWSSVRRMLLLLIPKKTKVSSNYFFNFFCFKTFFLCLFCVIVFVHEF